jgi:lysophospholipase L1-like esterase
MNASANAALLPRSLADGVTLRMLPLGDSITWGFQSSDGNGYRLDLKNLLSGNQVIYVGSQQSGSMANNENEGHPGALIDQIATYAQASLPDRPNVVLLMAGTGMKAL